MKRKLQEETHKKILREKLLEKENETQKEEQARLAIKEKALKASEKLESLKGDWQSAEKAHSRSSKKSKGHAYDSDSSDEDEGNDVKRPKYDGEENFNEDNGQDGEIGIEGNSPAATDNEYESSVFGSNEEWNESDGKEAPVQKASRVIVDDDDDDE